MSVVATQLITLEKPRKTVRFADAVQERSEATPIFRAEKLLSEGARAKRKGNYAGAIEKFNQVALLLEPLSKGGKDSREGELLVKSYVWIGNVYSRIADITKQTEDYLSITKFYGKALEIDQEAYRFVES